MDVGDIDGVSVPEGDGVAEQLPADVSRVVAQASGHGQLTLGLSPPRQKNPTGHSAPAALVEPAAHAKPGAAVQFAHSSGAARPAEALHRPGAHREGSAVASTQYDPTVQIAHVALVDAPSAAEKVPAGQGRGMAAICGQK